MLSTDLSSTGPFKRLRIVTARVLSSSSSLREQTSAPPLTEEYMAPVYMSPQAMEAPNAFKLSSVLGMSKFFENKMPSHLQSFMSYL